MSILPGPTFDVKPLQLPKRRLGKHCHFDSHTMVEGHERNGAKTFYKGKVSAKMNGKDDSETIMTYGCSFEGAML